MHRINLLDQIGSFQNQEEKGLFTFYLQYSNPSDVVYKSISPKRQQKLDKKAAIQKMQKLKQQTAIDNSRAAFYKQHRNKGSKLVSPSDQQTNRPRRNDQKKPPHLRIVTQQQKQQSNSKDVYNFTGEKDQQLLQMLLFKNKMADRFRNKINKKQIINHQCLNYTKNYTANSYCLQRKKLKQLYEQSRTNQQQSQLQRVNGVHAGKSYFVKQNRKDLIRMVAMEELNKQTKNQSRKLKTSFSPLTMKRKYSRPKNRRERSNQILNCGNHASKSNISQIFNLSTQNKSHKEHSSLLNNSYIFEQSSPQNFINHQFRQRVSNLLQKRYSSSQVRKQNFSQIKKVQNQLHINSYPEVKKTSNSNRSLIALKIQDSSGVQKLRTINLVRKNRPSSNFQNEKALLNFVNKIKRRYQTI